MPERIPRRLVLKQLTAATAGLACSGGVIRGQARAIVVNGTPVEIVVASVSRSTVRLTVTPIDGKTLPDHDALVAAAAGQPAARRRHVEVFAPVRAGDLTVRFSDAPPTLQIENPRQEIVQKLTLDPVGSSMSFQLPKGPLLGLGEGGPQFDRKGHIDRMRNGQGGYQLRTHGSRVPATACCRTPTVRRRSARERACR